MYDVFLSHNRQQKSWVRLLYRLLVEKGLSVFFDEVSIAPGQNIVTAIEEAIARSRHVVLVLSPASLASKWVAMETQLAVHSDLDARMNTLVPVIIEPVSMTEVRPVVRSLNCVDLTDRETRKERLLSLFEYLGIPREAAASASELEDVLDVPEPDACAMLTTGGIKEILSWGWDGMRLLDEFIKLDYLTLDRLLPSHEGNSEQWAPVFMNHPDTWRMLVRAPQDIVGYWHFAPLFPEDYSRARAGALLDSEITADRVRLFELPGSYEIYFVQVCLLPNYRKARNLRFLFGSIYQVLEDLAEEDITVPEVCANAYTEVGRSLCRSFNMQFLCSHREHGDVFAAPIRDILRTPLASRFPRLLATYRRLGML